MKVLNIYIEMVKRKLHLVLHTRIQPGIGIMFSCSLLAMVHFMCSSIPLHFRPVRSQYDL